MENPITAAEQASDKLSAAIDSVVKKADELVGKLEIDLEAKDKLAFSELENEFLKVTVDIHNAQRKAEAMQKRAQEMISEFSKKYAINPLTHAFDGVRKVWRAL